MLDDMFYRVQSTSLMCKARFVSTLIMESIDSQRAEGVWVRKREVEKKL